MNIKHGDLGGWALTEVDLINFADPNNEKTYAAAGAVVSWIADLVKKEELDYDYLSACIVRLLEGRPLTPIEDKDCEWKLGHVWGDSKTYQSIRYPYLKKIVGAPDSDKTVCMDPFRVRCIDVNNPGDSFCNAFVDFLINTELYPIELPYTPGEDVFTVYVEQFNYRPQLAPDVFDTLGVLAVRKNSEDGIHQIYRYFKLEGIERGSAKFSIPHYKEIPSIEYASRRNSVFGKLDNDEEEEVINNEESM